MQTTVGIWKYIEQLQSATYLYLTQEASGLLQGHRFSWLMYIRIASHFLQPPPQLLWHLLVVLPLSHQTVDDASPLLGPAHHTLPLVAQQSQFHAKVVTVSGRRVTTVMWDFILWVENYWVFVASTCHPLDPSPAADGRRWWWSKGSAACWTSLPETTASSGILLKCCTQNIQRLLKVFRHLESFKNILGGEIMHTVFNFDF